MRRGIPVFAYAWTGPRAEGGVIAPMRSKGTDSPQRGQCRSWRASTALQDQQRRSAGRSLGRGLAEWHRGMGAL
jgi:hypothetical protein